MVEEGQAVPVPRHEGITEGVAVTLAAFIPNLGAIW